LRKILHENISRLFLTFYEHLKFLCHITAVQEGLPKVHYNAQLHFVFDIKFTHDFSNIALKRLWKVMRIFIETIRSTKTTGMTRNKSYALECYATNPTRWNAMQKSPTRLNAAQQILRTEMPRNKSNALDCRATNPTRWNAEQEILRTVCRAINPTH
jgi:hypothetical protein